MKKLIKPKVEHKVKHFIRTYKDLQHPENYIDIEVNSRTIIDKHKNDLSAIHSVIGYQFYDTLTAFIDAEEIVTKPRNFSKLFLIDYTKYNKNNTIN